MFLHEIRWRIESEKRGRRWVEWARMASSPWMRTLRFHSQINTHTHTHTHTLTHTHTHRVLAAELSVEAHAPHPWSEKVRV